MALCQSLNHSAVQTTRWNDASVIIGLALVCSKASPFGWNNHDLTTKKWQLNFQNGEIRWCHFPKFEFLPHLILVSCSLGTHFGHESTGVHAPPKAEAKQVATSTIRRDGMETTTTSVQVKLKRKLQCKSVKKCCIQGNWVQRFKLDCLFKRECHFVFMFAKKMFCV